MPAMNIPFPSIPLCNNSSIRRDRSFFTAPGMQLALLRITTSQLASTAAAQVVGLCFLTHEGSAGLASPAKEYEY